jgi:hypothetical protein
MANCTAAATSKRQRAAVFTARYLSNEVWVGEVLQDACQRQLAIG